MVHPASSPSPLSMPATTPSSSSWLREHLQRPRSRYLALDSTLLLVPEGTGTTEIGINLTHTNSARGTIYVDNVRMREVSMCVYDEELDETDFGDLPQTFYEEGSYQDSVFRDGVCSELGGSASCSTPEGLKDCSSDSDRVGLTTPPQSAWEPEWR